MSVEIKKDITTVQVEIPKTNVAVENAVTNINVQTSQPQLIISQAGVSGRDGTSGTSGTFGNVLSSSLLISGSIIPNVAEGNLTSSFSLGSATNAWKDLWISKGTIYFIGDNNQTASISINAENQIEISDINLTGSITASLAEGYLWVGGPDNKNIAIPTASLVTGGSGTFGVNGTSGTSGLTITGSAGTSGVDGTSGTSGLTITGSAGSHGTSGTSGISVLVDSGSLLTTSSFNEYSSSIELRMVALEYSSSINISGSNGTSGTSGLTITGSAGSHGTSGTSGISPTSMDGLISSSQQITDLGFVSSSTVDTTQLNNFTGSIRAEIDGIEAYTASLKATTLISGAAQITALGFGAGGGDVTVLNTYTGSNNNIINRILQTTASLNTLTSSVNIIVSGLMGYTASLKSTTLISSSTQIVNFATFATLNANNFNGNQVITGSLTVSSIAISEATLFASSSNLVLNSGSNLYINNGGLASISGSLKVTGSIITTLGIIGPINATNGVISSSQQITDFGFISSSTQIQNYYLFAQTASANTFYGNQTISGSTNLTGSVTINNNRIDDSWTAYTPQWTAASSNPAINNGTIEGYYKVVGKTCFVRGNIAMGSTTTFGTGEWYVSMPFTASHADAILMTVTLLDNTTAWYNAIMAGARAGFNHKAPIQYQTTGGTAGDVNATAPFTWTNGDRFVWNGSYEIA
jgi:hypothetical protein